MTGNYSPHECLPRSVVEDMTGYKLYGRQRQWLDANGYAYELAHDGRPLVLLDDVLERQLDDHRRRERPDFNWMDGGS